MTRTAVRGVKIDQTRSPLPRFLPQLPRSVIPCRSLVGADNHCGLDDHDLNFKCKIHDHNHDDREDYDSESDHRSQ